MSPKMMLTAISAYQYSMLVLASILFLVIPAIEPQEYFDSRSIDIFVRCALWVYFVGSYWSISIVIKNRIAKKSYSFSLMHKNIVSFVLLVISATLTGVFLSFLTKWSLVILVPQFPEELIFIVSLGNGVIYAMLILSQYYFLTEE